MKNADIILQKKQIMTEQTDIPHMQVFASKTEKCLCICLKVSAKDAKKLKGVEYEKDNAS